MVIAGYHQDAVKMSRMESSWNYWIHWKLPETGGCVENKSKVSSVSLIFFFTHGFGFKSDEKLFFGDNGIEIGFECNGKKSRAFIGYILKREILINSRIN